MFSASQTTTCNSQLAHSLACITHHCIEHTRAQAAVKRVPSALGLALEGAGSIHKQGLNHQLCRPQYMWALAAAGRALLTHQQQSPRTHRASSHTLNRQALVLSTMHDLQGLMLTPLAHKWCCLQQLSTAECRRWASRPRTPQKLRSQGCAMHAEPGPRSGCSRTAHVRASWSSCQLARRGKLACRQVRPCGAHASHILDSLSGT